VKIPIEGLWTLWEENGGGLGKKINLCFRACGDDGDDGTKKS
jgi:hypothetical protein